MKKFFVLLTVFAVVLLAASTAMATIVGSKHDLRSNNVTVTIKAATPFEDLCIICHTPHNAVAASAPLWNRSTTMEISYNTYTTARGNGWTPGAASKACLGCHDGSLGVASLVNPTLAGQPDFSGVEALMFASAAAIGKTADALNNDHPVGIIIPATGFDTAANIELAGLNLYGASNNTVECGTCHDAHEYGTAAAGTAPFLAINNLNSNMCLECHLK